MALFKKKTETIGVAFPAYLVASVSLLALGLLFLLCFNQPEYAMNGGESDSLKTTIAFTALLVLSVFSDFACHYAVPNDQKFKKYFLFGTSAFEFVALIVGFVSYYSVYNEMVLSIRFSRIAVVYLVLILWLIGVFSKFLIYIKNPKNIAKLGWFLDLLAISLATTIANCFTLCVHLTMEMPLSHYCFVLLLTCLTANVLLFMFFTYCLTTDSLGFEKKMRLAFPVCVAYAAFTLLPLVSSLVAYEVQRIISFRSFYWMLATSIAALLGALSMAFLSYFAIHSDRLPEFEDDDGN